MDLSVDTPNKSALGTPSPWIAPVTSSPGVDTPVRSHHNRANLVMLACASPVLPVSQNADIRQPGYTLLSQAGGFFPSQGSSQVGQRPTTVHPMVSVQAEPQADGKIHLVSILKPGADDTPLKVAAPEMCNPTNQFAGGYCDSRPNGPKTEVRPSMVLCAKSCVTDGRTNSPELFDSEDLSSQPPNTCQVMANIDNVLEEIAGDAWSDIQVALGGAVVKTEHARPQTRSGLVSHIVKSKMRNGLPGLDVKERCRLSISPCHQSVDTSHQSVDVSCHQSMETASDMKCNSIQSRKPLFKYIPKRLISDPLDIAVVEPGKIIFHSDTVTHNDAADNILKVAVRSNTRMASKLNLHQSSVDSVGQHDQSESEKQIQAPVDDEPGHMVTRVKREPVESAVMADITVVSDGTPLKRNVRNKRRRNFGGGSRKKGRGVEFINVETEGSTREVIK